MRWFARWYARRIVNVNVNIVLAGAGALAITVGVMHPLELSGFHHWVQAKTGLDHKLVIGGLTFLVDLVADVIVYFALHWLANHWPGRAKPELLQPQQARPTFMRDATMVQVERMILAPLFYVIALGAQHALLRMNFSVAFATATGFTLGIICTRALHTMWMLRLERRWQKRLDQDEQAAQMDSLSEEFDDPGPDQPAAPDTNAPNTTAPESTAPNTTGPKTTTPGASTRAQRTQATSRAG